MLLAFIGAMFLIVSVVMGVGVVGIVIGAVLLVLGLLAMSAHEDNFRAHKNRQRYWAYGEEPDWKRKQRKR